MGFLDRLLGPLLKHGLSLVGNVLKPLADTNRIISSITSRCNDSYKNVWIWRDDTNTL